MKPRNAVRVGSRWAVIAALCFQLSGCFFIWIPPGLIRALAEPRPEAVRVPAPYKGPAVEAVEGGQR